MQCYRASAMLSTHYARFQSKYTTTALDIYSFPTSDHLPILMTPAAISF